MANVIKHKRGSGSDPAANNLVLGELAIRTDTGKLFTKMDSGAIAEIAGGGSDIAINTLSSSSGTGGGSATFNGSAYRFTLSAPPSVSAQQLLVSINGVIQKPVAGTGQPSEGFSVDGTDIILGDAPATGSDFFILTFKSLGVSEPADNSVTSAKIVDGAIVNADINASAAIAGTKITPTFTSAISQSDSGGSSNTFATNVQINTIFPSLSLNDSDSENDFQLQNQNGLFVIRDADANVNRFTITSAGVTTIAGNLDVGAGLDVTGAITGTGDLTIDTNTLHVDSSNNRVGIGTTSPSNFLEIEGGSTVSTQIVVDGTGRYRGLEINENGTRKAYFHHDATDNKALLNTAEGILSFATGDSERMRIDSSGNMLLGLSSTSFPKRLNVQGSSGAIIALKNNDTTSYAADTNTSIEFGLNTGNTGNQNGACEIRAFKENGTNGNNARGLSFYTGANGGSPSERIRITSSGHLFHNCTSSPDSSDPGTAIIADANQGEIRIATNSTAQAVLMQFRNPNGVVGDIRTSGSGIIINGTSDYRVKENAVAISDGITRLKTLKPYRFNFKADPTKTLDGFFAHEVTSAVPEAVTGTKDEIATEDNDLRGFKKGDLILQGIDQSKLVPLLVAALQEAIGRIEALEAK